MCSVVRHLFRHFISFFVLYVYLLDLNQRKLQPVGGRGVDEVRWGGIVKHYAGMVLYQ